MKNIPIASEQEVGRAISRLAMADDTFRSVAVAAIENEKNALLENDREVLRGWIQFIQLLQKILKA